MAGRRSLRLSTRVTLFFGAVALLFGIGLTVATFLFARSALLEQRVDNARNTASLHALTINEAFTLDPANVSAALFDLDIETNGCAVVLTSPRPIESCLDFTADDFPQALVDSVSRGQSGRQ